MTTSPSSALTLYDIESKLAELLAIEASIMEDTEIHEGDRSLALAAVDREIEEYFAREVKKVDNIALAIRTYQAAADEAGKEAERIRQRALRLQATADRIKASTLSALAGHGIKRVETPTNVLRIQGNGGLAPLVIDDPAKLPARLTTVEVTIDAELWDHFKATVYADAFNQRKRVRETLPTPDNERIRAAIAEGEEVSAHLGERGVHLRLG
jgi:hypothetical protein